MNLTKLDAASRQLDVASELFVTDGNPLALHTLSGAAEEILGKLVERAGEQNMFTRMGAALSDRMARPVRNSELTRLVNSSRNARKHANESNEDPFNYNPNDAVVMLFRALINYQLASGGLTQSMENALERLGREYPCLLRQ